MTAPLDPRRHVDGDQVVFEGDLAESRQVPVEQTLSRERDASWDYLEQAVRDELEDSEGFSIGRLTTNLYLLLSRNAVRIRR